MGLSGRQVVRLDRQRLEDLDEQLGPSRAMPLGGELDTRARFGDRGGGASGANVVRELLVNIVRGQQRDDVGAVAGVG